MTYIIAGIYNGNPFLMVDCIGINTDPALPEYRFANKINRFYSLEQKVFYVITGSDYLSQTIDAMDRENYCKGNIIDYDSQEFINLVTTNYEILNTEAQEIYNHTFQIYKNQRLYIIDKYKIIYYDLKFENGVFKNERKYISNNEKIMNVYDYATRINPKALVSSSLYDYCKYEIESDDNAIHEGIKFKNRFTFIEKESNGELIYNSPFDNDNELISAYVGVDFIKNVTVKK